MGLLRPWLSLLILVQVAFASNAIPKVLHQIQLRRTPKQHRVWAAEIRKIHSSNGWKTNVWKEPNLFARYSDDPLVKQMTSEPDWRENLADQVLKRFAVLLLRDDGGVFVNLRQRPVQGRTLDHILDKLHPSTTFFASLRHPGLPGLQVNEECKSFAKLSDRVKQCGTFIPISTQVMGSAPGSRAILAACGWWYFSTSPAEEIGENMDGQSVLFSWRYFAADQALPNSVFLEGDTKFSAQTARIRALSRAHDADDGSEPPACGIPAGAGDLIPKTVHQIWIGSAAGNKPIPAKMLKLIKELREAHEAAGWTYKLWGNELYKKYRKEIPPLYLTETRIPAAVIQDHFKVLLMRDYGGVFIDVDVEMVKSFDYLLRHRLPEDVQFFAGLNFPKSGRRNKVGLRGGPPVSFTVMGCSRCSRVVRGLAAMAARPQKLHRGNWFWPSRVEKRPEWAVPLHNGWGVALQVPALMDERSRLLNYHVFMDDEATDEAIILHQPHHLWSWFEGFKMWKGEEKQREARSEL